MTPFPPWVTAQKKMTPDQQRRNILTFLVRRAALQIDGTASYRALAQRLGFRHTTFCAYVARGRFSRNLAMAIENLVGRDLAPHELLMDPLSGQDND